MSDLVPDLTYTLTYSATMGVGSFFGVIIDVVNYVALVNANSFLMFLTYPATFQATIPVTSFIQAALTEQFQYF